MNGDPIRPPLEEPETLEYDSRSGEYRVPRRGLRLPRTQTILFLLTIVSTVYAGGFAYAGSILAILLTHEMGHYVGARLYRIPATLPYFIPFPISLLGTLGAVIRMDGRGATRRQLFDVGIAGPLAGLVVAIPLAWIGIALSDVVAVSDIEGGTIELGESLLFQGIIRIVKGPLPEGETLLLHPVGLAGWAGLLVTALNLLPVGQLDGGHILYGLFGRDSARYARIFFAAFALFALLFSPGWLLFVLLLLYLGYRHPPALEEEVGLDRARWWLGMVTLGIFVLTFSPYPIRFDLP